MEKKTLVKVNHQHTLLDIHNHVDSLPENEGAKEYQLMTRYPRQVFTDLNATVKQAGLLNAVLIQSLSRN